MVTNPLATCSTEGCAEAQDYVYETNSYYFSPSLELFAGDEFWNSSEHR